MSITRKIVGVGVAITGVMAMTAGPALAMDCLVVNRSAQGNAGAAHSAQWFTISINDILVNDVGACPAQVAAVDAAFAQAGYPLVFVSRSTKTLPSNGHGIIHIDDTLFPLAMSVLSSTPC